MNTTIIQEKIDAAEAALADLRQSVQSVGSQAVEDYVSARKIKVGKPVYCVYWPDRKGVVVAEAPAPQYPALRSFTVQWEPCLTHPKGKFRKGIRGSQLSCYLAVDLSR